MADAETTKGFLRSVGSAQDASRSVNCRVPENFPRNDRARRRLHSDRRLLSSRTWPVTEYLPRSRSVVKGCEEFPITADPQPLHYQKPFGSAEKDVALNGHHSKPREGDGKPNTNVHAKCRHRRLTRDKIVPTLGWRLLRVPLERVSTLLSVAPISYLASSFIDSAIPVPTTYLIPRIRAHHSACDR